MSDFHVLKKAADSASCSIVAHLTTPAGSNVAGVPWRAVVRYGFGSKSRVPRLSEAENKLLMHGELIEVSETVTFSAGESTNAQRLAKIKTVVTQMQADIQNTGSDLYKNQIGIYEWFTYSGNV